MTNFVKLVTIKPTNLDKPQNGKNYMLDLLKKKNILYSPHPIIVSSRFYYVDDMMRGHRLCPNEVDVDVNWVKEGF
jgi:hypothetical protein